MVSDYETLMRYALIAAQDDSVPMQLAIVRALQKRCHPVVYDMVAYQPTQDERDTE